MKTKALEVYKEERRPVFKSSPSQFMTVIYSVDYKDAGKDTGKEMGGGHLNGQLKGQLNGQLNDSQKETFGV